MEKTATIPASLTLRVASVTETSQTDLWRLPLLKSRDVMTTARNLSARGKWGLTLWRAWNSPRKRHARRVRPHLPRAARAWELGCVGEYRHRRLQPINSDSDLWFDEIAVISQNGRRQPLPQSVADRFLVSGHCATEEGRLDQGQSPARHVRGDFVRKAGEERKGC